MMSFSIKEVRIEVLCSPGSDRVNRWGGGGGGGGGGGE